MRCACPASRRRPRTRRIPARRDPARPCPPSAPCAGRPPVSSSGQVPQIHLRIACVAPMNCLTRLILSNGLQVGKSGLEILADHAVHIDEDSYELRDVGHGALHGPGDVGRVTLGFQREFDDVLGFERLDEIQLDGDLGRSNRLRDFHAPLADVPVAFPCVYGALAAGYGAESSFHRRVFLFPGRPGFPAQEIVEYGKDLLRRSLDARRALDTESIRFRRGIDEKSGEQDDGCDDYFLDYYDPSSAVWVTSSRATDQQSSV